MQTINALLLDEIDEIFRKRLTEAEQSGANSGALNRLADKYHRMYSLVDAGLTRESGHIASEAFKDETYEFVAEGFFERIQKAYEPAQPADQKQADQVILQTRHKLQRIQCALFSV